MIVLVWSVRGLHDLFKQRELRSLQVEILCIVETRVKEENAMRIHENIVFGWGFINNYSSHYFSRIWVCWNTELVHITTIQVHTQAIIYEIEVDQGNVKWIHTFIYGATKGLERRSLWQHLGHLKLQVDEDPWMLFGDFNAVLSIQEKWGKSHLNCYETEFSDCVNQLEMLVLSFTLFFHLD